MVRSTAGSIARFAFVLMSSAGMLGACSHGTGGAIPVEQYKEEATAASSEYMIDVGDLLNVVVFEQPSMSGRMRVRNDGRITLPFVNDVIASGKTPTKLASELEAGFKAVVLNPRVTVSVEESRPLTISVLGEVAKPGTQQFERDSGIAQALASAGGLSNFAHKDRIFVVRTTPKPVRIHFTYEEITRKVGPASAFKLKPGDVVIVE
jgi:polysaccharide export outer membrane protein